MNHQLLVDLQIAADAEHPEEKLFNMWAELATDSYLKTQNEDQELTIRIVEKTEIQYLNREYRNKNAPTNVLSFPYEQTPGPNVPLLGDLIICADVVIQEAKDQNKTVMAHWAHMVIHGILHLLGYDHIEANEAAEMEQLEVNLLSKLGYANPYV